MGWDWKVCCKFDKQVFWNNLKALKTFLKKVFELFIKTWFWKTLHYQSERQFHLCFSSRKYDSKALQLILFQQHYSAMICGSTNGTWYWWFLNQVFNSELIISKSSIYRKDWSPLPTIMFPWHLLVTIVTTSALNSTHGAHRKEQQRVFEDKKLEAFPASSTVVKSVFQRHEKLLSRKGTVFYLMSRPNA